jgi:hypothetical protein
MRLVSRGGRGRPQDLATRLGRTGRWVARLLVLGLLVQAGSPAFVSACQLGAGGDAHGCPACRAGGSAPATAAVPAWDAERPAAAAACHCAAATTRDPAPAPAPKPCCFLEGAPVSAQEALPEVTLAPNDGQLLPLELAGDPDGTSAEPADAADRLVFPPGSEPPLAGGPPDAIRFAILQL